jgi:hypothetical protein
VCGHAPSIGPAARATPARARAARANHGERLGIGKGGSSAGT